MGKRRRQFTGGFFGYTLWLFGVMVMLWWLPELVLKLFPQLAISSQDPWRLTTHDLTWKRFLVNTLSKPGFRFFLVIAFGLLALVGRRVVGLVSVKTSLPRISFSSESAEWVIEGRRTAALSEYGRWLQVV